MLHSGADATKPFVAGVNVSLVVALTVVFTRNSVTQLVGFQCLSIRGAIVTTISVHRLASGSTRRAGIEYWCKVGRVAVASRGGVNDANEVVLLIGIDVGFVAVLPLTALGCLASIGVFVGHLFVAPVARRLALGKRLSLVFGQVHLR